MALLIFLNYNWSLEWKNVIYINLIKMQLEVIFNCRTSDYVFNNIFINKLEVFNLFVFDDYWLCHIHKQLYGWRKLLVNRKEPIIIEYKQIKKKKVWKGLFKQKQISLSMTKMSQGRWGNLCLIIIELMSLIIFSLIN
jgi:hypothetical protein